jgi:hypothetical protein
MPDIKDVKVEAQDDPSLEKGNGFGNGEIRDIGAQLFAEGEQISLDELEREGAEVRRILDKRIMPMVSS